MKAPSETRLLVVEDDPFLSRILEKRFGAEGYQVFLAADGRAGMKAIVQHEPDVVISDWMMPEVDGLELCQSVKTGLREAAPYFILLTAKGDVSDKLVALDSGADDYVTKPCDPVELLARVRAGIRIVGLAQSLRRTVANLRAVNSELEMARQSGGDRAREDAAAGISRGSVHVCASCHRVRSEAGDWMPCEEFLRVRGESPISQDACADCRESGGKKFGSAAA
ncbi:MAG: response regulator transcription factor [Candidatus Eisenbacteria bacterium]|uniref:Response regulator transcription factor n=1 Tax=Eiseniibacteriota bacterium TaxID=2212470 RepID=A0A849T175_UNCEI|nr:response regulator transcription factor [Candidatus Eisenbacteria bacterium]